MKHSARITRLLLLAALCTASSAATLRATPGVVGTERGTKTQDSQPAPSPSADEPAPEPDLTEQRTLVNAAFAALDQADLAVAREQASEAIDALLDVDVAARGTHWLQLLNRAGLAAWKAQDPASAKRSWEQVLEFRVRTLPADHPDLLAARQNLAVTLNQLGDLAAARAHEEAVLEARVRTLHADHPDLLYSQQMRALTLRSLGDLAGARALEKAVLEARERTLPEDHPHLIRARGNLAMTMAALGDLAGARELEEAVLLAFERTLPEDHPALQIARGNLAMTMAALGDLAGARELQEAVLSTFERTLHTDHPALLSARERLAGTMNALGDVAKAHALFETVLEARERALPEDHPDLVVARLNLAVTLRELGDLASARALMEAVLDAYQRMVPADHPDLLLARENLAGTMRDLGDLASARALEESVLEARVRSLPENHPDLLRARHNLAATISRLGDLAGARALEEAVLEARERTLPDDHPDLLATRGGLAATIKELGDLAGARALEETVLEAYERTLPKDHPALLTARGNLAATMSQLGDFAIARVLEEAVLEVRERTLPAGHPDLLMSRSNLAATMYSLGDLKGARVQFEAVLEARQRAFPKDHPESLLAHLNLAATLKSLGDFVGARAHEEAVLAAFERTLPNNHPDLLSARLALAGTLVRTVAMQRLESERQGTGREEVQRETGWTRALALVAQASREWTQAIREVLVVASVREAEERAARGGEWPLDNALSFAAGLGVFEPQAALYEAAFALSESSRGAGILSATVARSAASGPKVAHLRAEVRAAGAELADVAQRGAVREEYHRARRRREMAERELIGLARASLGDRSAILEVTAEGLGRALEEGEALVGYRRYTRRWFEIEEREHVDDEARVLERSRDSLGAFVLARVQGDESARLAFVDLGPFGVAERAVHEWRAAIGVGTAAGVRSGPGAGHEGRGIGIDSSEPGTGGTSGAALRRLVWDPILDALGGAERVVVALDDMLHLVPLETLELDEGAGLVGERWRIETRVALWELLDAPPPLDGGEALVSLGGASFDSAPLGLASADLVALETGAVEPASAVGPAITVLRGGAWERGFAPLNYTRTEALGVAALFKEAFDGNAPSLVLELVHASREALVETAPRARFLHVATHGWFAPD